MNEKQGISVHELADIISIYWQTILKWIKAYNEQPCPSGQANPVRIDKVNGETTILSLEEVEVLLKFKGKEQLFNLLKSNYEMKKQIEIEHKEVAVKEEQGIDYERIGSMIKAASSSVRPVVQNPDSQKLAVNLDLLEDNFSSIKKEVKELKNALIDISNGKKLKRIKTPKEAIENVDLNKKLEIERIIKYYAKYQADSANAYKLAYNKLYSAYDTLTAQDYYQISYLWDRYKESGKLLTMLEYIGEVEASYEQLLEIAIAVFMTDEGIFKIEK